MSEFEWHIELGKTDGNNGQSQNSDKNHKVYINGNISVCFDERSCVTEEGLVKLSPLELSLFEVLASRPNFLFSNKALSLSVWGNYDRFRNYAIKVHIRNIRRKLGATPENPISGNVREVGYALLDQESCLQQNADEPDNKILMFPQQATGRKAQIGL